MTKTTPQIFSSGLVALVLLFALRLLSWAWDRPVSTAADLGAGLWLLAAAGLCWLAALLRIRMNPLQRSDGRDFFYYLLTFALAMVGADQAIAWELNTVLFSFRDLLVGSVLLAALISLALHLQRVAQIHFGWRLRYLAPLNNESFASLQACLRESRLAGWVELHRSAPAGDLSRHFEGLIVSSTAPVAGSLSLILEAHLRGLRIETEDRMRIHLSERVDSSRLNPTLMSEIQRRSWMQNPYRVAKIVLEPIAATVLALLLSPLLLFLAFLVRISSPGPVIFRQIRMGHRGRPFTLYKFRTMVDNAEQDGPRWWNPQDPRVTRLGRFLRSSHLDELPQLLNVIKGDLSFIGPRPELPAFYDQLEKHIPHFRMRTLCRPGITGWAQVRRGYVNSTDGSKTKLDFDLYYMFHSSPVLDLQILADTLRGSEPDLITHGAAHEPPSLSSSHRA